MAPRHVFISHTTADDAFVTQLRRALEGQGIPVWADSQALTGGDDLPSNIQAALERARHVIAVLSPRALQSDWVRREVGAALSIRTRRRHDGVAFNVIPVLLSGVEPSDLRSLFTEEPLGVRVPSDAAGALAEALPELLAALGERLPADRAPRRQAAVRPLEELTLDLSDPQLTATGEEQTVTATAVLLHGPAGNAGDETKSDPFPFALALGSIEAPSALEDLNWYLAEFHRWPAGVFQQRADRIAARFPQLGRRLHDAVIKSASARRLVEAWQAAADGVDRSFSVSIASGTSAAGDTAPGQAACVLFALPWELLHDGRGYLFQGRNPVRVRRRLPGDSPASAPPSRLPMRILLVCPRPDSAVRVDHRASAAAVVHAVESLGELATFTVLTPPTFGALQSALARAAGSGAPFDIVHFDGYGASDLAFEDAKDVTKLERRAPHHVPAHQLAEVMRDHRIPLVFLEVWQSEPAQLNPTAAVASQLLAHGVSSVVAMSHAVLTETARRFVAAFYLELAQGSRIGAAMVVGQRALYSDTYRDQVPGAGTLRIQDWFVPVLYQQDDDPPLVTRLPSEEVQQLAGKARKLSLGALPPAPKHSFVGRSRELLTLERLLDRERFAVIRGRGGAGKTTLAVELARWLARTARFAKVVFVSLEQYSDARGVLDALGRQLLPEGSGWSVATFSDLDTARQPVERALREYPTIIVLDNFESVLPAPATASDAVDAIFQLCHRLLEADPATRLLFTTRELLPEPFGETFYEVALGPLDEADAIQLVNHVLARQRIIAGPEDPGDTEQTMRELVNVVGRHARALVLIAPEVARSGAPVTTAALNAILADLDRRHPGDRENSMFASVKLSLLRTTPEIQERLRPLAAFAGGAQVSVMAHVLDVDVSIAYQIAQTLEAVGLADQCDHLHFQLDPAFPAYLRRELDEQALAAAQKRWAEAMQGLVSFLYENLFTQNEMATELAQLELPNLMALLAWAERHAAPDEVVGLTSQVEQLLSKVGRSRALADLATIRKRAQEELSTWSHAQHLAAARAIDAHLDRGELSEAVVAARRLLEHSLAAGTLAHSHAAYDTAMARFLMGRTLNAARSFEQALQFLADARRDFEGFSDEQAARMVATASGEMGDGLRGLERLDEAATAYGQALDRAQTTSDSRGVALYRRELGSVRLLQERVDEAVELYQAALPFFETSGEARELANTWHQLGMAYRKQEQFQLAEQAYKKSLAIEVQRQNRTGEAETLFELGTLYAAQGLPDDAIVLLRQACDLFAALNDPHREALCRQQLAAALIDQGRPDEAREPLARAVALLKPYGDGPGTWRSWASLHALEQKLPGPAAETRPLAIASYLAHRRAGGPSETRRASLYARVSAVSTPEEAQEAKQWLADMSAHVAHPQAKAAIAKLLFFLDGARTPDLADDPALGFMDVAELKLLLERT